MADERAHALIPVFERNGTRSAMLFGSYANGTQAEYSDIYILVDSGLSGLRFYGLLEDVYQAVGSQAAPYRRLSGSGRERFRKRREGVRGSYL